MQIAVDAGTMVAALALIVSVVTFVLEHRRGRANAVEQAALQRRMLALEEARDTETRRAAQRAVLRAAFISRPGRFNVVEVRNVGAAPARDIAVSLDGARVGEPGSPYASDQPPSVLGPDDVWQLAIFTSAMTEPCLHVVLAWTDDTAEPGRWESELSVT